jgi:hypothetical protein
VKTLEDAEIRGCEMTKWEPTLTKLDQTARNDRETTVHRAPAASLTGVSIRSAARHSAPTSDFSGDATRAVPTPLPNRDSVPPIIEICAEESKPARSRAFPSVQTRPPKTIDATAARHPSVAPSAIIDLWEHLAADRLRPKMSDVDPVTIAGQWPNSLLLRVTQGGRRPGLEVAHMFAPPAGGPTSAIPIDAMTVDWIVSLGREVVITGGPVHETDAVPTVAGPISCGVIALPFGPEAGVDHVLCHLYRVDDRVVEGEIDVELSMPPRDRTGIKRLFGR